MNAPNRFSQHAARLARHAQHAIVPVDALAQEALELEMLGADLGAHADQLPIVRAHRVDVGGRGSAQQRGAGADHVDDHFVDHAAHDLMHRRAAPAAADRLRAPLAVARTRRTSHRSVERDQAGAQAVVDVVVVVGDLIGEIRQLRLETGLRAVDEALADVAELTRLGQRAVLENALAGLEA